MGDETEGPSQRVPGVADAPPPAVSAEIVAERRDADAAREEATPPLTAPACGTAFTGPTDEA